jgi:nucleoside phosphorylase
LRGSFVRPERTKEPRNRVRPLQTLTSELRAALPGAHPGIVLSLDSLYRPERDLPSTRADVADMQTAALLRTAEELGVALAALLIVTEKSDAGQLRDEDLEASAKAAGRAAATVL